MPSGLRSFLGSRWSGFLLPLSFLYGRVAAGRRKALAARSVRLPAPVISVGNITCGGTGKTPAVEMLCRMLLERGRRPAVLSRGYRPGPGGRNDEALVLEEALPGTPVICDPDRVRGGRKALAGGADVLVLDDGFQHVRLKRDLDLVLIDALDPFGGGRVLPAGFLREPLGTLGEADLIAITRGALVPPDALGILRGILRERFPGIPRIGLETEPRSWEPLSGGESLPPGGLRGRTVAAVAGIGNPEAFRRTLLSLGVEVAAWLPFPDHHRYGPRDLERIRRKALLAGAQAVVTTAKDAVKLRGGPGGTAPAGSGPPWLVLRIATRTTEGDRDLAAALDRALLREAPSAPAGAGKESRT